MDFQTRVKLSLVLLAITFGFTWLFMSCQSQAIRSAMERSSEDFRRDPEEVRASARDSATAWREALAALKARRPQEAWEAAGRAGSFQYEMFGSENLPYEGSQTVAQWFAARQKEFADAVVREFERVAERAAGDPAQSAEFTSFYLRFLHTDKRVGKVYESRKGKVLAARLKAARGWVRVAVISKTEAGNIPLAARMYGRNEAEFAFTTPIEEAFRHAWKPTGALSYVTGALLDEREEDAAWLTLVADVRIATALYQSKWRGTSTPISVEVPHTVQVSFRVKKSHGLGTTWDRLPSLRVERPPPQAVAVEESTATDQVAKLAKDQQNALLADLQPKLDSLPAFALLTAGPKALPPLVRNGQPDPEAAALLGVLDPTRLAAEAAAFAATNPSDGQGLLAIALDQRLEGLASWSSGWLATAAPAEQEAALGRLRQNPAFGEGRPLVALAKGARDEGFRRRVFEAMAEALHEPRIFEAIRLAIAAAQGNERRELIRLLVGKIPPDRIAICSAWAADPDPEVARMVYQTLQQRDPETASGLIAPLIGSAPEEVQLEMLDTLKRGPERLATATVTLLRSLVARRDRQRVYREAWELLADTCAVPAGWQAVRELEPTLTDSALKSRVRAALAQGAVHVGESAAMAMLDQSMAGTDPEARKEAAHRYFRVTGDIDARVSKALPLIAHFGGEKGFFEALLRGFSENGMSKVKKPSSPDLRQMLERAAAHDDKMVRSFAHSLMYRAWSKGAKDFAELLRAALAKEKDSWVKSQCANHVRAIDQAEKPGKTTPEAE